MGGQGAHQAAGALGVEPATVGVTGGVVLILGLLHSRPVDVQVDVVPLPRIEP